MDPHSSRAEAERRTAEGRLSCLARKGDEVARGRKPDPAVAAGRRGAADPGQTTSRRGRRGRTQPCRDTGEEPATGPSSAATTISGSKLNPLKAASPHRTHPFRTRWSSWRVDMSPEIDCPPGGTLDGHQWPLSRSGRLTAGPPPCRRESAGVPVRTRDLICETCRYRRKRLKMRVGWAPVRDPSLPLAASASGRKLVTRKRGVFRGRARVGRKSAFGT